MSKLTQYVRHLAVVAIATLAAQCAWADKVIAINFGETNDQIGDTEEMNLLGTTIAGSHWNQFFGASGSATSLKEYDTEAQTSTEQTVGFSFSAKENWRWGRNTIATSSKYLISYLDDGDKDGHKAKIEISNLPYTAYDVVVFMVSDTAGDNKLSSPTVNGSKWSYGDGIVKKVTSATAWGKGQQTTAEEGKNAIRISRLSGNLVIDGGKDGGRGSIAAIAIYEAQATIKDVSCGSEYSISEANNYTTAERDIVNLNLSAGATLTLDEAPARDFNIVSEGKVLVKGAALSAENLVKLANKTAGYIFRIEGDLSEGTTLDYGAGTYSFENAKVSAQYGADYKVLVLNGDTFHLADRSGTADGRTSLSLDVQGGTVTIGKADGNGSFWYGTGAATTYNQTDGEVTCTVTGTGTSGSGNGLLLGWSGALASMNVSGGTFSVPNSSLNFWDGSTTLNVSGGMVKAKGVFKGNSNGHQVVLSDAGTFELGSIGWTGVGLTLNGGTFKAYENTTMAGAITMGGAANIEVPADVELKLTGSVTGEGAITKKGEGVLNVGTTRPTMDVKEGSVKIVATPSELVAGVLTLTVTQDATPASKDKVSVWDSEGNEVEIIGVSIEGTTITITLKTLPSIDKDTAISELKLDPAAAGLIVVNGGETEEESITITFDAELPEGVSMEINGFVEFVAGDGIEIPYAKMVFGEDATLIFDAIDGYDIPAGAAVIAGTASGAITNAGTLKIGTMTSGSITNSGTLTINGDSTFTLANTGTITIAGGTSTVSSDAQAIKGTINIAYGATYKCASNDQVPYGGSTTTTINVRGTLDMQNHRWTVGGADTINLYGGCMVLGSGDKDGIFDLYRNGNVINVQPGEGDQAEISVVTIPAPVRARNANGNIFIAQGMKLALTGGIKNGGDVAGATINMNGNGRLTGTIPLYGGTINLGTSVGTIDAKFVAESGDTALKLGEGAGYTDITTTDTAEEPIIWIKSGATLQLYVKDFSSWTGASTEHAWVKNDGTLNIRENGGSRYFRGHLVMKPGTTTTLYGTTQNFIVYGGNSDQAKAQMIVPASEEAATATFAGEGTIQLNVNGSGGTNGSAWDIGANSTLDVQTKIIGGEALVKYGEGTLKLTNAENTYNGAVTLKAGTIVSAITLNVTCGDANKKLETTTEEGVTTYTLVQRDATNVYLKNGGTYALADGAAVTLIDGDVVYVNTDSGNLWPVNLPAETASHKLVFEASIGGNGVNITSIPAGQTIEINNPNMWAWCNVGAGAKITGTGIFEAGYTSGTNVSTINDGVVISSSFQTVTGHKVIISGSVTISGTVVKIDEPITLSEGAELTITEQDDGKVISGVEGKVAEYDGTKYTLATATYKVKVPTVDNATVSAEGYTADEDGYITVNHGASVTFTVTPNEGYNIGSTTTITLESVTEAVETVDVSAIEITDAKTYVAQVGDKKYETLQAAFEAVTSEATITLLADVEGNITIPEGKSIVLMGEYSITPANTAWYTIDVKGSLTINGPTINGVEATIANNPSAIRVGWDSDEEAGTKVASLTLNSGAVVGGLNSIKGDSGAAITIAGGEITHSCKVAGTAPILNYGTVSITGGKITANSISAKPIINAGNGTSTISGGTFIAGAIADIYLDMLADGYNMIYTKGGMITASKETTEYPTLLKIVGEKSYTYYCANIDSVKAKLAYYIVNDLYMMNSQAFKAGNTVKLACDVSQSISSFSYEDMILDLNGYTFTDTKAPSITKNLIIKNGMFSAASININLVDVMLTVASDATIPEVKTTKSGYHVVADTTTVSGATVYSIAKDGPAVIEDVTTDNVADVIPETVTTAETDALVEWIQKTSGITTVEGLKDINVNALIFNCSNESAPAVNDKNAEATAADAILKDLASKVDISKMADGTLDADTLALLEKEYPMATIKLMDVTTDVAGEGATNTHLFKLSIELK